MSRVFGGALLAALVAVCGPSGAQSPMTPVRSFGQSSSAAQWVEPPPAAHHAETAARAAPDAGSEERQAQQPRPRRSARTNPPSSDHMANLLNRRELNRIRSGGGVSPYRAYWSRASRWGY